MRVSIGILAWNAEHRIARTLEALFDQDIFDPGVSAASAVEVVCVSNGCTDNTEHAAAQAFETARARCSHPGLTCRVCPVAEAGKTNAWNRYVHEFSDPEADYIVLMDDDIWFTQPDTISLLVLALESDTQAHCAVDAPIKDIASRTRKTLFERLSLAMSRLNRSEDPQLCGQLYCARASAIRRIWMPAGLVLDDGFLKPMFVMDVLSAPKNIARLVRVPDASHVFEACSAPRELLAHERALRISGTLAALAIEHLRERADAGENAGEYVARRNAEDPGWYHALVRKQIAERGWRVVRATSWRLRRLREFAPLDALRFLPIALIGFLAEVVIVQYANLTVPRDGRNLSWPLLYRGHG